MSTPALSQQADAQPIVNLTVQDLQSRGPKPVAGWTFSPVDLNTGVGGDYIYVGWQRGTSKPITRLSFGAYNRSQQGNPAPNWEWNPTDLNRGAGGQYIYMFWKRDPGFQPIYGITFIVTPQSSPPPVPGYQAINLDLNRGAGGPYIWAYVTHQRSLSHKFAARSAIKRSGKKLGDNSLKEAKVSIEKKLSQPK